MSEHNSFLRGSKYFVCKRKISWGNAIVLRVNVNVLLLNVLVFGESKYFGRECKVSGRNAILLRERTNVL